MLLDKAKNEGKQIDYQLVDTIVSVLKTNIALVENFRNELSPTWQHGWAYYYLAKAFFDYYPDQTDTIFHYLDKATELMEQNLFIRNLEAFGVMELKIYICQLHANTLSLQGKMQEAYRFMNESLYMLDELKGYQVLDEQRLIACQFMADYYEKANKPAEALKYQKLLRESEAKRYDKEKVQALNDMSIKYETEKKEMQIQTLARENKAARHIMLLIVCMSIVLLTASVLVILWQRQKRKNAEQQLYESALLAELKQNELEQTRTRMKQQMEQKPTKAMIGKLTEWISKSIMERAKKNVYIQKLSELDVDMLEQGYLTADEKISNMDMKYLICFAIDMEVEDMTLIFNVQPTSIHTVRYRIKKKFKGKNTFKFLM